VAQCKYYEYCSRDVEDNSAGGLCILHSTDSAKDTHAFAEALAAHRERYGDNFSHFVFPGETDFGGITFTKKTTFAQATFTGEAIFDGATFADWVDFARATFTKAAMFARATFTNGGYFVGATFTEEVNFLDATFTGKFGFNTANFCEAKFTRECGGWSDNPQFAHAKFRAGAEFREVTFCQSPNFDFATFHGGVDFSKAAFTNGGSFRWATFIEGDEIGVGPLEKGAAFREATFARATFARATFSMMADFGGATLDATFAGATFTKAADFGGVTFNWIDFSQATFTEGADFSGATFPWGAKFGGATFSRRTIFAPRQEGDEAGYIFAGAVDFRHVVINPPDAVTFLEADLTRCQFLGTDLRKVQLVGVTWPRKGRRTVICDDINTVKLGRSEDGSARPWSQVERLYRELKQNYEDRRDYERAGDFHYGEKEMRRQNPETARGLRFF
jgi:uncharacterized protein YjbI with pentapeptide repeats